MCKVTICALAAFAIVKLILGEQHTYGDDPYRRSVFSGSDEADFYLNSANEDVGFDLGKFHHPQNAKKMSKVKRLSPTGAPIVVRANYETAEHSWSKYLNKLSDLQIMPSSEEVDPEASAVNFKMDDSVETSYGYLEEVNTVKMNDSHPKNKAQKWFPILQKNANDEIPRNSAKKDIKPSETSTFRPWKSEDLDDSMRKFVDWMLTALHQVRYSFNETEPRETVPSVKQRRFDRTEECTDANQSKCRPCVINIFNSSNIGYLVLSPNSNSSEDCVKLFSNKEFFDKSGKIDIKSLQRLEHTVDLALQETTPDMDNSLVRWDRSNVLGVTKTEPSVSSAVPSAQVVSTSSPEVTPTGPPARPTSADWSKSSLKSVFNAPQTQTYPSQFYPYQPPYNSGWKEPPNTIPNLWPKYRESGYDVYKPVHSNPTKFDDRGGYDPYRDLPYDIPSVEFIANSQEFEYPPPYQMNREFNIPPSGFKFQPFKSNQANEYAMAQADDAVRVMLDLPSETSQETRQNEKLRDTLSNVGLFHKSDRPAKSKQSDSSVYNQFPMSQPGLNQRDHGKSKPYGGSLVAPPKRTMGRKAAPSTFLF